MTIYYTLLTVCFRICFGCTMLTIILYRHAAVNAEHEQFKADFLPQSFMLFFSLFVFNHSVVFDK